MGCDIHMHTEFKVAGEWHHAGHPDMDRNYRLFEKMAGVRGSLSNAISAPKGLPDDLSFTTKFCAAEEACDSHSHSYLSSQEIMKLQQWYAAEFSDGYPENQWGYFMGNGFVCDWPAGVEDVRFVFWFDN